jgi:predicted transcriptional regulator
MPSTADQGVDMSVILTSKIVAAYLGKNTVAAADIPALIRLTYSALVSTSSPAPATEESLVPAVPVKKSVTPGAIICLECGNKQKMLKRHLGTAHDLTVDEYRTKWSLPADYPMVASDYAARRSQLAHSFGLGRKKSVVELTEPATTVAPGDDAHGYSYPASRWSKPSA